MSVVYLNDKLVNGAAASVSIYDAGLLHGVGLFETMRAYGGKVFCLEEHLSRLFASVEKLELPVTQRREEMAEAIDQALRANKLTEARVRLTVTSGTILSAEQNRPLQSTLIVTAGQFVPYPSEYYQRGMTVVISPFKQNGEEATAGHKTLNYFPRLRALQVAQKAAAGEALFFTTTNRLAEGCYSNVFLVKDGTLITPSLDTPVLPGIVRQKVIELARENDIEVVERECVIDDVMGAEEIFLTNSIMELMPVGRIERHAVGRERPGPVYQQLRDAYLRLTETTPHPL